MNALVVYSHPIADSFCAAMRDAAVRGLLQAGHHVDVIDLYDEDFNPVMARDEWHMNRESGGAVPAGLERHVALVQAAQILVFVYPTWWSTMPAILKGWLERVLIEKVAYAFTPNRKIRPAMTHVRRIYVFSTFGSPRWYITFVHNNGKRTLTRALRLCAPLARTRSRFLYSMDTQTQENREKFLRTISQVTAKS